MLFYYKRNISTKKTILNKKEIIMPFYDFVCKKCKKQYEELCSYDETEKYKDVACPYCKSKKKEKVITVGNFKFSNPIGTGKWISESTGHDYRHKWNVERKGGIRDQRKFAEENSHMGKTPYNKIDDISSGKNFGEVK